MVEAYKDHEHQELSDSRNNDNLIQEENRMLYRIMPIVGAISLGLGS